MKTRLDQAERELANHLSEILANEPNTLVSRTEFRAESEQACDKPIEIVPPVLASEVVTPTAGRVFSNDFSPLGSAIVAAIQHAGDGPAEIFLVSDWAESPGCGISIRDALSSIDTSADVSITPILVRPNDTDLENARLMQRSYAQLRQPVQTKAMHQDEEAMVRTADELGVLALFVSFAEKWLWLIAFFVVALNAMLVGFANSYKSVETERKIKKVELLHDSKRQGHQGAEDNLNNYMKDLNDSTSAEKARYSFGALIQRYWYGSIAILVLVLLATLPPWIELGSFRIKAAQDSAWLVLNSDFATAFAVLWTALIFFYGVQSQRRREAVKNFDEAIEAADRARNQNRYDAHATYSEFRTKVASLVAKLVELPMPQPELQENAEKFDPDAAFEPVKQALEKSALRNPLAVSKSAIEDNQLVTEIKRLRTLIEGSGFFPSEPDLSKLIVRLIETRSITENVSDWKSLSAAISGHRTEVIWSTIRKLAEK